MTFKRSLNIINFKKILSNSISKNIGWLFFDKVCRLGVGLCVGIWVARYLGPEKFGSWNYAIAIVAILSALATLGLDQILVKNLIEHKQSEDELMGSAFFLRFSGSILAILISCLYVYLSNNNDLLLLMTLITGINLVFQCFDIIDLKLQSELKSRISVIVKNSAFIIASILKLIVIIEKGSLIMFVIISLVELVLGATGLIVTYGYDKVKKWRLNLIFAMKLLTDGWPLILSGIIILLYMRLDQVMIGRMLSATSVGLYSVSVRFSELWYFIPSVFVNSFFPKLIQIKNDSAAYNKLCLNLLKILFVISFSIAIIVNLIAGNLISFLYGHSYLVSAFALKISIWTAIFVFWGVAAGNMLVIENLNKHNLYKSIAGLAINIILNLVLIPQMGINGAAIATLISQFFASYLYYLFPEKTRHIFFLQTKSILFFV